MSAFLHDINKLVKTTLNGFTRRGVFHFGSRRAFALRINESEHLSIADFSHEVGGRLEIFFGFAREADDNIGGEGNIGVRLAHFSHQIKIVLSGIATIHGLQHAISTRLNGKVQGGHEVRQLAE